MDGVLTATASVHANAWRETFDDYLRKRTRPHGTAFVPFDPKIDYPAYLDGRPRVEGVRHFLASRGLVVDEGTPDDSPDSLTSHGLGNYKNEIFRRMIDRDGVKVFPASRRYLVAVRDAGLRTAVVSSSANTSRILKASGLDQYLDCRIGAIEARRDGLRGKPAPDTYLAGARCLGVEPARAAVFEDALVGVEAGRSGGFGYVVGVDRIGHRQALQAQGADLVVTDLGELLGSDFHC